MSAAKAYIDNHPDDDDHDDDDDEEADFVPGVDDEEEEEDDFAGHVLDGKLTYKNGQLLYRGEGFHLASTSTVDKNVLEPIKDLSLTIEMTGSCEIQPSSGLKPAPRTISVSWNLGEPPSSAPKDDDEKAPSVYYQVYGRQEGTEGDLIEFRGGYYPEKNSQEVSLVCQARTIAPVAAAAAAKPAAAAAAPNSEDEADEEEDADDDLDYDELIALRQDADLSVDELRKRYNTNGDHDEPATKREKIVEEEDDYGF
jgi:hypothetical protein